MFIVGSDGAGQGPAKASGPADVIVSGALLDETMLKSRYFALALLLATALSPLPADLAQLQEEVVAALGSVGGLVVCDAGH